jgi:hypothetical protein
MAPALLAAITTTVAFGYPRFRYATDVCLVVLAAYALTLALARAKSQRRYAALRGRRRAAPCSSRV